MIPIIVICGPTASGKTEFSHELSNYLPIEIISADSRQIYKHLNIGTAKPTTTELKQIKHHFIDILEPTEEYNAYRFGYEALDCVKDIYKRNKMPVVVGGSGLYIRSLCDGFFDTSTFRIKTDSCVNLKTIREQLQIELNTLGADALYERLKTIDEPLYNLYSDKNPRRVLRALEFYEMTNIRLSDAWLQQPPRPDLDVHYWYINYTREELYERINKRTEQMFKNGLLEETESIMKRYEQNSVLKTLLATVGYKEAIQYIKGDIDEENTLLEIAKNTRRYAKRQITWFKKINNMRIINPDDKNSIHKLLSETGVRFNK